ncbi:MAG: type II secretion system protein [Rhodoferax sp.]
MKSQRLRSAGFTILEMALSLFAIGFLLSAAPRLLEQGTVSMAASPGSQPAEAAELALKSFVLTNSRLPCPATSGVSGVEACGSSNSKGFVPWKTLGMARPLTNANGHPFAYALLRGTNDLGAQTNVFKPTYLNNTGNYYAATVATESAAQSNGLDFCAKLRSQASSVYGSSLLSVRDARDRANSAKQTNVAWVLVDPGSTDPAFNGDNNPATSVAFESPARAQAPDYDDKVTAGTLTQMFADLRCPTLLAAVSAAAREADFAQENWRVRSYLYDFRVYQLLVRQQKETMAFNFQLMSIFDVSLTVALSALNLGIALAGPASAGATAVSAINMVTSISMSAFNLSNSIKGYSDAQDEVAEGITRRDDASTAKSAADAFRTARRAELALLDERGWFE